MRESPELAAAANQEAEQEPATQNEASQAQTAPSELAGTEPGLEDQLKKAQSEAAEHHDAWLRAKAEADNVRKRAQAEIASAHKFGIESFASELLAVKDSLEAALASENASAESMKSGIELTLKQLTSVFDKFSLAEISPAGEKFDPHRHQAVTVVECDAEPNTVMQVLQKGYLLHERVIRPALVTVAKAKSG
ncbi:MAG: nucleotide exchange factor GrpE [Betaproteobacteria bacterium]|nr:nucleotide exchange factor GrpE [Betaproteobacteria bacterium]